MVRGHAIRGVALDVLHRLEAFTHGEREVLRRHIVLEIHEGLGWGRVPGLRQHTRRTDHAAFERLYVVALGATRLAGRISSTGTGLRAFLQRRAQAVGAAASASGTFTLHGVAWHEHLLRFIEAELAPRLREQVHGGRVAAGHQDGVAIERLAVLHGAVIAQVRERNASNAQPTESAEHGNASADGNACRHGRRMNRFAGSLADIGDALDLYASRTQLEGREVGSIAACYQHNARTYLHTVAVEEGSASRGQHDARAVVARKHERTFDGTGGQNHFLRTHLPQPLTGHARHRRGQVLGQALVEAEHVVREVAEARGAAQQGHVAPPTQRGEAGHQPFRRRLVVHLRAGFI